MNERVVIHVARVLKCERLIYLTARTLLRQVMLDATEIPVNLGDV